MRTLIEGFRDVRDREAAPKHHECATEPERGIPLYDCRSSKYVPYQSLRMHGVCDGGGEADERVVTRCGCGAEVGCDDVRCSRCGNVGPWEER